MDVKPDPRPLATTGPTTAPGLDLAAESEALFDTSALLECLSRDIDMLNGYGTLETDDSVRLIRVVHLAVSRLDAQASRLMDCSLTSAASPGRHESEARS